ncbi:MAG: two-component regulator propeller domain-containing protein, partial [bacterium]
WEICAIRGMTHALPAASGNQNVNCVVWMDNRNYWFSQPYTYDIFSLPVRSLINWTGDEDFSTGVYPTQGGNGTDYTFQVDYLSLDTLKDPNSGESPTTCQVWIDLNRNGKYDPGEKYGLLTDPNDLNPEDGQRYTKDISLDLSDISLIPADIQGVRISYRFYFESEEDIPATGSANLKNFLTINPPWLFWTGETNYTDGGVYPQSGESGTTNFRFRVMYCYRNSSDAEAEDLGPDLGQVWIDRNLDEEYQENEKFTLNQVYSSDQDYTDGKLYSYSFTGSNPGSYKYRFYFEHRYGGRAVGEPATDYWFTIKGTPTPDEPTWTTYTTPDVANNLITCLTAWGKKLWAGTPEGLSVFNGDTEAWTTITPESESNLAGQYIRAMVLDSASGTLYVGTNNGLSSYNGSTWKKFTEANTNNVLGNNYILALAFDKVNKRLWLTRAVGQAAYDQDQTTQDPNASGTALIQYNINDNTWIKYTKDNTSSHTGGGLPSDTIWGLTVDSYGDVWVSTFDPPETEEEPAEGKGLSRFEVDEKRWTHYTTSTNNSDNTLKTDLIGCINGDTSGTLWVAGYSESGEGTDGGLYRFDLESEEWSSHFYKGMSGVKLGSNMVSTFCVSGSNLWVGTYVTLGDQSDGGASLYNGSSWVLFYNTANTDGGLVNNNITAIAVQGEEVWFGTLKGLSRYGFGPGGGGDDEPDDYEKPFDPNNAFFLPSQRGCFTSSFGRAIHYKSILNYVTLRLWWIFLIISVMGTGLVISYFLRRYLWVRK